MQYLVNDKQNIESRDFALEAIAISCPLFTDTIYNQTENNKLKDKINKAKENNRLGFKRTYLQC